jgi:Protein of unknown function (DUF3619)
MNALKNYSPSRTQVTAPAAIDRWAKRLTSHLMISEHDLPAGVAERLRVARLQAQAAYVAAHQKQPVMALPVFQTRLATALASFGASHLFGQSWMIKLASALPLVLLLIGLPVIGQIQDTNRAHELAEFDTDLLADDLPLNAYTDPGFAQYLKSRS